MARAPELFGIWNTFYVQNNDMTISLTYSLVNQSGQSTIEIVGLPIGNDDF